MILSSFIIAPRLSFSDSSLKGSYNLSPTAVTGSARNVGLAGATVAFPDGYSANFTNPAGLGGLTGSGIDFGSDSNQIDNFVVDLNNPKSRALNDPIKYSFYGFRFVSDDGWGFGFSAENPFSLDNNFNGTSRIVKTGQCLVNGILVTCSTSAIGQDHTELKINNNTYTLAVGKSCFDKRVNLGLAVNYIQVSENYSFNPAFPSSAPISEVTTNDTFAIDVGAIARPYSWLQVGAVYKMGYRVAFDPSRNVGLPSTSGAFPFRDIKVPDKFSAGLAWMPHKKFNLFVQSDYTLSLRDGLVVASGLFPGTNNVLEAGRYPTIDGHWGIEFIPINEPDLTFKLWAGGYLENTAIQGGFTRYHRTAGFGLSPWFLNLNISIDDTNLYNNFVVGLGVDLLQVASRVAKRYGWKLPV